MSFAKAQRFSSRESVAFGSPADYDISIRLGKDYNFGKNPKFQGTVTKNGTMSFVLYPRSNCSSRSQLTCSTHKISVNNKKKNIRNKTYNRSFIKQGSVKNKISSNQLGQKCQKNAQNRNGRELFDEFENLPSTSGSVTRRESNLPSTSNYRRKSIDDDSDSLTFSEDSGVISGNRLYLLERFNNQTRKDQSKRDTTFQEMVLVKIGKIEKHVEQMREVLAYLSKKIQTGQMQEQHDEEDDKKYIKSKNTSVIGQKYEEIAKIIAKAIKNLREEVENKRQASLRHIEENMRQVVEKMYIRSNKDSEHLKKMCETASASLVKEIFNILNSTDVVELEYELSDHDSSEYESLELSNITIREIDDTESFFNYENTCKLLSDQLWNSKNELDVLERDKLDITIKFSDIQRALEEQGSLMDILQTEINNLRLDVTKNV